MKKKKAKTKKKKTLKVKTTRQRPPDEYRVGEIVESFGPVVASSDMLQAIVTVDKDYFRIWICDGGCIDDLWILHSSRRGPGTLDSISVAAVRAIAYGWIDELEYLNDL